MKLHNLFVFCGLAAAMLSTATFISCDDDEDYAISNNSVVTQITTGEAVPTAISAVVRGTVSGLASLSPSRYQVGTVFGTSEMLESSGTRVLGKLDSDGSVTTTLTGLTQGQTYYYATFVTLQGRVTKYGETKSFMATNATVATAEATQISACKAVINGQINGANEVLDAATVGFRYALSPDGVADGYVITLPEATGSFSAPLSGLLPGTTYYYAAFSGLDKNELMGEVRSFTTASQAIEYVDLGLSVLWAKTNIGAESEEEAGATGGFGDLTFFSRSTNFDNYTPWDLVGSDDMVYLLDIDGESTMKSHMPTIDQYRELLEKTTQSVEEVNGVKGVRFTGAGGASIFLPLAGYREGEQLIDGTTGYYWTNQISKTNERYAKTVALDADGSIRIADSELFRALSVRTVRLPDVIKVNNDNLVYGDLEGNGRLRLELYNEWGSTKANPVIDVNNMRCEKNLAVTFRLSGISGNLKDGAPTSFVAGLEYSDPDWSPSYWSDLQMHKYEAVVSGDGTYTVWAEFDDVAEGAVVFCIDIADLMANIVDPSLVKAEIVSVDTDVNVDQVINTSCVEFQNKDNNGVDGRIEIYNEFGKGGSACPQTYNGSLAFNGMCAVQFTISGIEGNLKDGADGSYKAEMSYADASWDPSYWGGASYGFENISKDGTYTVFTWLNGDCEGAVVWAIELYGLWKDLVDPSAVTVSVDRIMTPHKL